MDILGLWPNGFNHRSCLNWTVDLNKGHKSSQQFKWKLWESQNCKKGLFSMEITKQICEAHVGIIETSQTWLPRSTSHSFRQLLFGRKVPHHQSRASRSQLLEKICAAVAIYPRFWWESGSTFLDSTHSTRIISGGRFVQNWSILFYQILQRGLQNRTQDAAN